MNDKGPTLRAGLYALIDDSLRPELPTLELARAALSGGAPVLQLRLKRTSDREALALARAVVALARPRGAQVLVNDRVDLALLSGADGVHLGEDDLPVAAARRVLGPGALIGATVRDLDQIARAQAEGADHVGLGPIFETRTKVVNAAALGVDRFAALVRQSPLPVVGIAGITLGNVAQVARAGARAAAVASDLLGADDVAARARALHASFIGAVRK